MILNKAHPPTYTLTLKTKPTAQNLAMNLSNSRSHIFLTLIMIVLGERDNLL